MDDPIKQVELNLIKMGARAMFSDVFARDASFHIEKTAVENMVNMFVTGRVYGEANFQEYRFKYPADWWQAVKERFAPAWFLRCFPVLYTHHQVVIDIVYPELSKRIKLPKEAHFMILNGYAETDEKDNTNL